MGAGGQKVRLGVISISRRTWALMLAGIFAVVLTFLAAERYWPMGPDYFYHYRPLAEYWLAGNWHTYAADSPVYLAYPPWSAAFIAPLGLFSLEAGKAALFVLALLCLFASLQLVYGAKRVSLWVFFASAANMHTFDMLLRGQLDSVVLFGLVLAWWAVRRGQPLILSLALCIATVKPPANIVLPLIVVLIQLRHWRRADVAKVAVLPTLTLIGSFVIFGVDWPVGFVQRMEGPVNYLSISLWRAADLLSLPAVLVGILCAALVAISLYAAWRLPLSLRIFGIAIAANLLITPYANGDHYVLLIPAFVYVAQNNKKWSVVAYILTFTPLLRIWLGYDAAVVDILYPVFLLACLWFLDSKPSRRDARTVPQESLAPVV
jgi:hypothetical protein